MTEQLPLDGIKVLDLTRFVAGPWCTSLLGDMGADVIKVEPVEGGDGSRSFNSLFGDGTSSYFVGLNRSKRSISVDLRSPKASQITEPLLRQSDVLISNFRPGVMRRLGLDYDAVRLVNPRIVYCSISAYGDDGPYAEKPGMDGILQAMGGVMGLTGQLDGGPVRIGVPVADYTGAFLATAAVVMGLFERERSGAGRQLSINLLDGQLAMLANLIPGFAVSGKPSEPSGTFHQQIEPSRIFETSDGHMVVSALTEAFWRNFATAVGAPHLIDDPRFADNSRRVERRDELMSSLQPILRQRSTREWISLLEAADVPCAPVNRLGDIMADPQVAHNQMLHRLVSGGHDVTVVGNPFRVDGRPHPPRRPPPGLGEHTVEVLREIGLSAAEIQALIDGQVVRAPAGETEPTTAERRRST
jgi:crotonobetainyl-CoA:carnitine CoA-transferase CaiB-like acyl-CoA transferase